jgi:hypothetical protein
MLEVFLNKEYVGSREYKIMLKAKEFEGDENHVIEVAVQFWSDFKKAICAFVIDTDGKLNKIKKRRTIRFYDTDNGRLRANGYVFRERTDLKTDKREVTFKREVTLKFRHPDRYLAQDRNMEAKNSEEAESKFEQDIKPPCSALCRPSLSALYSFSTKQPISSSKKLNKMNDPVGLFPDLKHQLDDYIEDEKLKEVGNFTALEIVITGANFQLGKSPKVEAECALILWYHHQGNHEQPILAEFSFKYENRKEHYDKETAQRAYEVFIALQQLKWIDTQSMTKTAYVYSLANFDGVQSEAL